MTEPLAIVGIGCSFPKAPDLDAYWSNIMGGVDAIDSIPDSHWNPADYFDEDKNAPDMTYAKRGGFLEPTPFDALGFGISPNNIEATDTTHLFGLLAAHRALQDAGYSTTAKNTDGRAFDRDRTSCIMGVTGTLELVIPLGARLGHPKWKKALKDAGVDEETAADVCERISDSYVPWQENSFPGLLGNVAAGRIANKFDLGGTNCVCDAACASSLSAIHMAAMELWAGQADMAITGGIDTFNDIFMYMCFSKTPALSATGNSRPFAKHGDGTILGEGVGVLVLKRLADAERDGDNIHAVIRSIGSSSDGAGNAVYAPSAKGQQKALRRAYESAGVTPADIELVEAHGTGTRVGDGVELSALCEVYGEHSGSETNGESWCALGSVKSMIGHTKAAAGVAGLIKAILAVKNKVLPPTLKIDEPLEAAEPGSAPLYLNTETRPWVSNPSHPRLAAISAFGFGGSNFHSVIAEYDGTKPEAHWDAHLQLFAYSADDAAGIQSALKELGNITKLPNLRDAALQSRQQFNNKQAHRLTIAVDCRDGDLAASITTANELISAGTAFASKAGVSYANGAVAGELAVLFPGQGSQRIGMLRDLTCRQPAMLASLDAANTAFGEQKHGNRLSDYIYPMPVFDDAVRKEQDAALRETNRTQPALAACDFGAWKVLQGFGLKPSAFAGHSFGELVALAAAEVYSEDDLHRLATARGAAMAACGEAGDPGTMLAVSAGPEAIEEVLAPFPDDLVIANRNAPKQTVLSGSSEAITAAEAKLKEAKLRGRRIPVAAAFHSPLVAAAQDSFGKAVKETKWAKAKVPVIANKTAKAYPAKNGRKVLTDQLVSSVRFVESIEALYDQGVRCFVECGPGNVLSGLVGRILGDRAHSCISLDSSKGSKPGQLDLAACIGQLAALGHANELSSWDPTGALPADDGKKKVLVEISGANLVNKRTPKPPRAPKPVTAPAPAPAAAPSAAPAAAPAIDGNVLNALTSLQQLQEQTTRLHQQFLTNQQAAHQALAGLMGGQTALPAAPRPVAAPQPVAQAQAPVQTPIPAAPQPVAAAPTVPEPSPAPATTSYEADLLAVVAEKTGYPVEMLEPSMELDADLGIDSIKRVEILSAFQERVPDAPAVDADDLGALQTLGQIVDYLNSRAPAGAAAPTPTQAAVAAPATSYEADLLAVVAEKTGYPVEMLEPSMELDADLGIDSIKRVEILSAFQERVPDAPAVDADDLGALQTLGQIVDYLNSRAPAGAAATPAPASAAPAQAAGNYETDLLAVVAEKTGYPVEMLEPSMELDADLGIDSIKRVEILSAFQERVPDAPAVDADDLGALQTLGQIVDYLNSRAPAGAAATPAPVSAAAPVQTGGNYEADLLAVVAEKTGYPVEMLEPSMELDADLGIDSIKRVEILSAFQERVPDAPAVDADDLGALQTLGQIVDYLNERGGGAAAAPAVNGAAAAAGNYESDLLAVVADKTGYPVEMLEPGMELDADLGIDSIKRVEILSAFQERVPDAPAVDADDLGALQTLGQIVDYLNERGGNAPVAAPTPATAPAAAQPKPAAAPAKDVDVNAALDRFTAQLAPLADKYPHLDLGQQAPVLITKDNAGIAEALAAAIGNARVIDRTDRPDDATIGGLIIVADTNADTDLAPESFALLHHCSQALLNEAHNDGRLFATVSRMDGAFGFSDDWQGNVASGALAGIAKTASHEWDDVHGCAFDIAVNMKAKAAVKELLPLLSQEGPAEVGISKQGVQQLILSSTPAITPAKPDLAAGEAVVITGGAQWSHCQHCCCACGGNGLSLPPHWS